MRQTYLVTILGILLILAPLVVGQITETQATESQEPVYQIEPEYPLKDNLVIITEQEQLSTQRILWMRVVVKTEDGYQSLPNNEQGPQDGNLNITSETCPIPEANVDCWRIEISRIADRVTVCRLRTSSGGGDAVHSFVCSLS